MIRHYDPFVVPFSLGFTFLLGALLFYYTKWLSALEKGSARKIIQAIFSIKTLRAIREVFLECLLHRKIFRINARLGYMHMSLAFGWFMLIAIGKLETFIYTGRFANALYYPIFFRFFEQNPYHNTTLHILNAIMDLLLVFVLSGVTLAIIKRFSSKTTGMQVTTRHTPGDRWALATLWLIFPLRLISESLTAAVSGNGSIVTQPLGNILGSFLPAGQLAYLSWWGYSICLGSFMAAIPYSRYMHIPTEILLIFLRHWGVTTQNSLRGLASVELYSCSRCGICIDVCPVNQQSGTRTTQMVYFLRDLREGKQKTELIENCMMCGRCEEVCPVGISLTSQRVIQRKQKEINEPANWVLPQDTNSSRDFEVVFFAGCMSHLAPGIKKSMVKILDRAAVKYLFLDAEGSVCCGRPLKLAGRLEEAQQLISNNRRNIMASGAKLLVTSCPICYKSFKEDYQLDLSVMHHSEYIKMLLEQKKIEVTVSAERIVYHDPCELGRGSGIYEAPREVIKQVAALVALESEASNSLCCGGSVANLAISSQERIEIQKSTALYLQLSDSQTIATACPLCKKSIGRYAEKPVKDISEIIADQIIVLPAKSKHKRNESFDHVIA